MKVLIVGGGIGGITLAAFLEGSGIEYEIVEKAPDWKHQGYLISLWDNGRDILAKLGLAEEFDRVGSRVTSFLISNGVGSKIKRYDFSSFLSEFGGAITLVERSILHNLVLRKIGTSKITMNRTVAAIKQDGECVEVTFSNGDEKSYDAVVGADGVHSSIRNFLFSDKSESYPNWRVWCTWTNEECRTPSVIREYTEGGALAVIFSTKEKTMAWFMAPAEHTVWDKASGRVSRLRSIFKDEVAISHLFEGLRDEDILPTDLIEVHPAHWSQGNVVLLGDAAHSFGPYTGIGSAMAMEDAYVLAGELIQAFESRSISTALVRYQEKRKNRIDIVKRINKKFKTGTLIKTSFVRSIMDIIIRMSPANYLLNEYRRLLRESI